MVLIFHPTVRLIRSKYFFIHSLITLYPEFYKSWENDYELQMKETIKQVADEDPEILSSMRVSSPFADVEDDMKNIFYQAMAIEVYAFFESSLLYIHNQEKIPGDNFKTLKEYKGIHLSNQAQEDNEFVYNYFRVFRNYVAHNMDAEPGVDQRVVLSHLAETEKGISYNDDVLMITDDSLLLKALDAENNALSEICDELGYKPKTIGKEI